MKAIASIDPKLISLLGRKLYTRSPVEIITRELLQNSVDACKRANVDPKISIAIETRAVGTYPENKLVTIVTCEDNGCGMSQYELVNNFLCLGGTDKRGTDATGGFGIAKAAIMSGSFWEVETLDNAVNADDLAEGLEIRKLEIPRVGTKVSVTISEDIYTFAIARACALVYTSEVDVKLVVNTASMSHEDLHAGLHQEKFDMKSNREGWTASGIDKIDAIQSRPIKGSVYVRLNGLTQFEFKTFSDNRESNILIDLLTTASPDATEYPLNMSREGLTGYTYTQVLEFVQQFEGEPTAADDYVKKLANPDQENIIAGKVLYGMRVNEHTAIRTKEDLNKNITAGAKEREEKLQDIIDLINSKSSSPIMKFVNYQPTKDTMRTDASILNVWINLLQVVLLDETIFGVGFVGDENTKAMLDTEYDLPFFLINPTIELSDFSKKGLVLSLWESACHEVAHFYDAHRHNEQFCSVWTGLMSLTCNYVGNKLDEFADML